MDILEANRRYESWLGERIPLIRADLDQKHESMAEAPFPFLRATFYRWAQTWPQVSPDSARAPVALAVGDLHVENFGTWRDIEGRLIWGINDFDEACRMPYTCDLVRLAASAHLAIAAEHLSIDPRDASAAILDGYREGVSTGGRAFVLAEHHTSLRQMAVERLKNPEGFWDKLNRLKTWRGKFPAGAGKGLRRMLPERGLEYRVVHRVSGLGSLGRRRFVALAEWRGGTIAREAKELTDSAWFFAYPRRRNPGILYQIALDCTRRCPDPFVKLRGRWIVRRLAPDCSRVELASLPSKHDATRLLHAMGFETANIHLGTLQPAAIEGDLKKRKRGWLHQAASAMVESVVADWEKWRAHKIGSPHSS
ncbi:MAG TPA: DUF2252 family protein [Bryobacteraceae bacterium]|nr:DUF2252 family protein [Bryobacteraceae bacterium]